MKNHHRKMTGSVFVLMIFIMFFIVMPLLMMLSHFGVFIVDRERTQSAVEAAGLLAANDMSRIIINDQNFGYVSLSNYPPIGEATRAPDGEPLPVTGINTLIGTIRQNSLVARALGNQTMSSLVDVDRSALAPAIRSLNQVLSDSLNGNTGPNSIDIHGAEVDPVADVTAFLTAHLPDNVQLDSVRLSSGWLTDGGTTTIPVPQPESLAQICSGDSLGDNYKAFTNVPVGGCAFSFAGLGAASSLADASKFQEADNDHICSIVKIECTLVIKQLPYMPFGISPGSKFQCVACCQPYALNDVATKGVMTLRFSGGSVPGLLSWNDFLKSGNFHDNQVSSYSAVGGDYPLEHDAQMKPIPSEPQPGTSKQFAEHLYYWLRNGHVRPRLDAILAMVNEPFLGGPDKIYSYEFADNGSIARKEIPADPPFVGVTSDSQYSAVVDTSIAGGVAPVIIFRDNVIHLGTKYGGKHGGQPLAGYPLNWNETQAYAGDQQLAGRLGRRSQFTRGLALDIEIGGTRASTASTDVASMSKFTQMRKI